MNIGVRSFARRKDRVVPKNIVSTKKIAGSVSSSLLMSNSMSLFRPKSFRCLQPISTAATFNITDIDFLDNLDKPDALQNFPKIEEIAEKTPREAEVIKLASIIDFKLKFYYFSDQQLSDKYDIETSSIKKLAQVLDRTTELSAATLKTLYNILLRSINHEFPEIAKSVFMSDYPLSFGMTDKDMIIAIYNCLNIMLTKFRENIPKNFYLSLIHSMHSPCKAESSIAKDTLILLFKLDKENREPIFAKVFDEIEKFKEGLIKYFFIEPALQFFTAILKIIPPPIPPRFFATSRTVLFPLIKSPDLNMFFGALCENCEIFYSKDSTTALFYIRYMLKHWPVTDSHKQILLLNQLHQILYTISGSFFPTICHALCQKLFYSVQSKNYKVALTALNIIGDEGFLNIIISTLGYIPKMMSESMNVAINSWYPEVRNKAEKAEEILLSLCSKIEDSGKDKAQQKWTAIAKIAAVNFKGDTYLKNFDEINKKIIDCYK